MQNRGIVGELIGSRASRSEFQFSIRPSEQLVTQSLKTVPECQKFYTCSLFFFFHPFPEKAFLDLGYCLSVNAYTNKFQGVVIETTALLQFSYRILCTRNASCSRKLFLKYLKKVLNASTSSIGRELAHRVAYQKEMRSCILIWHSLEN